MKVLGIGDNTVDIYLHLNKMFPGGNALNFSVYAQKIGLDAAYLGVFGNDAAAAHIIQTLKELNVDISKSRSYKGENAFAKVNIIDGERVFGDTNKGGVASVYPLRLEKNDLEYIRNFDLIHTSCYSKLEHELEKLSLLRIPISFDFSDEYDRNYLEKVCPFLTFAFLSCSSLTESGVKEKLKEAISYGSKMAIATRGDEGVSLIFNNKYYDIKAKKIEPVDTLGAGDAFITAFLNELLKANFSYDETTINKGLRAGIDFASEICHIQGAFNYGKIIKNGGTTREY